MHFQNIRTCVLTEEKALRERPRPLNTQEIYGVHTHLTKLHTFKNQNVCFDRETNPAGAPQAQASPFKVNMRGPCRNRQGHADTILSSIYSITNRRLGDERNREIVSCRAVRSARACARSGCLVEFGLK